MDTSRIDIPRERLAEFCRKWKVAELSQFGSALREDFGPESDVDVLVVFEKDARWSLLELSSMRLELERLFGRPIDLVEKRAIVNPFRRHSILTTRRKIYAA